LPPADVPQTILSIARKVSDDPSVSLKTEFAFFSSFVTFNWEVFFQLIFV